MTKHWGHVARGLLFLAVTLHLFGCKNPPEPDDVIKVIPPTKAAGPGGPAYMEGNIKDYLRRQTAVTETHIYLMNPREYADTVLHVLVSSTNASFMIFDLPEGLIDFIVVKQGYLCAKIGKIQMKPNGNSFYNPNSSGYFIDSTIYITNVADSVGRPDAPAFGLQGYAPTFTVYFKRETSDSIAWNIVQSSGCDTLRVYRYDDPVFDPYENDVYDLKSSNMSSVSVKLLFFNWLKEVKQGSPDFTVVQP